MSANIYCKIPQFAGLPGHTATPYFWMRKFSEMKKIILALSLLFIVLDGCKKDKASQPSPVKAAADTTVATGESSVPGQNITTNPVTLTGIAPSSGTPGSLVTLTGTNFGTSAADIQVVFNGVPATVQSVSGNEIIAVVPLSSTGPVMELASPVTTPSGVNT